MIGPAAREAFLKSLHYAKEAENNLIPGQLWERTMRPMVLSLVALVRGIAYAFLQDEVELKTREEKKDG